MQETFGVDLQNNNNIFIFKHLSSIKDREEYFENFLFLRSIEISNLFSA